MHSDDLSNVKNRRSYDASKVNQLIVLDLRDSRGLTSAPDRPSPNTQPTITIDFVAGATANKNLRINMKCLYPGSYKLINTDSLINTLEYFPKGLM